MRESRRVILTILVASFVILAMIPVQAAIKFQNLGTKAPPTWIGPMYWYQYDQTPQTAISDFTNVTSIPGDYYGGTVGTSDVVNKRTIGDGWATWSNGYKGAVYFYDGGEESKPRTESTLYLELTLPAGLTGFYFYIEPDDVGPFTVQAYSDSGTTSGAISVNGFHGANGLAFFSDNCDTLSYIDIYMDSSSGGFSIGEFGSTENCPYFDLFLYDDHGKAEVCLNSYSGYWYYTILTGQYDGYSFTDFATVTPIADGYSFKSLVTEPYVMLAKYNGCVRKGNPVVGDKSESCCASGQASFRYSNEGIGSSVYDSSVCNDPDNNCNYSPDHPKR